MILDLLQIFVGLFFATVIGSAVNLAIDRLGWRSSALLAPLLGHSVIVIAATCLWVNRVSVLGMYIVLLLAAGAATAVLWRRWLQAVRTTPAHWRSSALTAGFVLLIALHGSAVAPQAKIFQAFPMDRLNYVSAGIAFSSFSLPELQELVLRAGSTGDYRISFEHPIVNPAVQEMQRRPSTDIVFALLNYNAKSEYYRLGNAHETLMRVLQFLALVCLCRCAIANRAVATFAAGAAALGYWFQYVKDFNAWGFVLTFPLTIASIALIAQALSDRENLKGTLAALLLITTAADVGYPENGLFSSIAIASALVAVAVVYRRNRGIAALVLTIGAVSLALSFAFNPYNLTYISEQVSRASQMVDYASYERLTRGFLNPYIWTNEQRIAFIQNWGVPRTSDALQLVPSILAAWLGIYFLMQAGAIVAFIVLAVLAYLAATDAYRRVRGLPDTKHAFLILVSLAYISGIVALLLLGNRYTAFRALAYGAPIVSTLFVAFLIGSGRWMVSAAGYAMATAGLAFGATVYAYQFDNHYEDFDHAYSFSRDETAFGPEHGKFRKFYSFDVEDVSANLKICSRVYVDLKNYYHQAYLLHFLESKGVRYDTALPYLNALFVGGAFGEGRNLERSSNDCYVGEIIGPDKKIAYAYRRLHDPREPQR